MNAGPSNDLGTCLVTGAGTAVGRALLVELSRRGAKARVLGVDREQALPSGVERVAGESGRAADWADACAGAATIFHCTWAEPAPSKVASGGLDVADTQALLSAGRAAGVARIVHASGDGGCLGEAGIAAEAAIRNAAGDGLATCALRSGAVWGGGPDDLLADLVELAARGWYVARPPDGESRCEITHVDGLAQAMLAAAERLCAGAAEPGPVYTLTDGPPADPLDQFEPVLRSLGFEPPRRRAFASWLIAWASLWSGLHRFRLATAPPVRAAFWRRLTRSRLEDPGTLATTQRELMHATKLHGTKGTGLALAHADRVLARWGDARRERIGGSWSLPFFIRLPNLRRTLAGITRIHRWTYLATAGRLGHVIGSTTFLLLHNVGRKSGREFLTPLLYVADGSRYLIAASNAGDARPPAWWLNLQASPETAVQAGNRHLRVRARRASNEEAAVLWPRMIASYRWFEDYHAKAGREIPLVILEPVRPRLET